MLWSREIMDRMRKILLSLWHDDYDQVDKMSERIKGDKQEEKSERYFSYTQFSKYF